MSEKDGTFFFSFQIYVMSRLKKKSALLFQNTNINNLHNIKDQQHNIHKVQFIFVNFE